jgi:LemA protein
MEMNLILGIIAGVILLILVIWFFSTYNRLVRLKENVNKSWADIDVLLKQRYDMMPNLINTVKGYASHEKELFEKFAEARQTASNALAQGDVSGVAAAEGLLGGMMPKIYALSEAYPELKADTQFLNLQKEITTMENQVADRREFYNASATNWNAAIQMIPTNIVAAFMSAERRILFQVTIAAEREVVKVEF